MPRIDDPTLKKKPFKKQSIRAWDSDLLEKLKTQKPLEQEQHSVTPTNVTPQMTADDYSDISNNHGAMLSAEWAITNQSIDIEKKIIAQPGFVKGSVEFKQVLQSTAVHDVLLSDEHNIHNKISKLSGLEQKIFFLVHDVCIDRKSINTGDIISIHFDRAIAANRNSRETAIKRLVKKGLIHRNKGKSGANATLNFSINEIIKNETLRFINNNSKYEVLNSRIERSYPGYKRNIKQEEKALAD